MKKTICIVGTLIVVAFAFVTIFSYTTSPVFPEYGNTPDSPIFQIIGKYWVQGAVPYKDLWDLKGPYIFFVNAMGYALTGTSLGVYLVQIGCMVLTLLCVYKMFRFRYTTRHALAMVLVSLMLLSYIYEGGNLTEEYLLPLLSLSFYLILRWIDDVERNGQTAHPPLYAIPYGVVLGLSLMSRLTNALPLCAAVAVIALTLLSNKAYRNLGLNAFMFLAGFGISTLPFVAYFHGHHALAEMWDGTFLYAVEYAKHSQNSISYRGIHHFILSYWGSILLMLVVVWQVVRARRLPLRSWLWLMSALLPFLWFCQGNGFGHYGMIVLPLFVIAMMEISALRMRWLFVSVVVVMSVACASKVRFMRVIYRWHNQEVADCKTLLKQVPDVDYTSFVAYNCDPNIYLALDARPAVPFFSLQNFAILRNQRLGEDVAKAFSEKACRWVLLSKGPSEQPHIQQLLDKDYHVVATGKDNTLILYQKNEPNK